MMDIKIDLVQLFINVLIKSLLVVSYNADNAAIKNEIMKNHIHLDLAHTVRDN